MRKQEFLAQLRNGLSGLPQDDREERLTFYSEMIDDRIEEGLEEGEAVSAVGSVDEIVAQILADTPISKLPKEKIKAKRRPGGWEIVLLVLGSPIWLSLLIAAFAVIFSLYIALWCVIISLWAVFASLAACAIGGIVACIIFATGSNGPTGVAMLAAGIICAGLSIFMFYGCTAVTKGMKKLTVWLKHCFIKKGEV